MVFSAIANGRKLRKSAFFGPFSTRQLLSIGKWLVIVPLPFIAIARWMSTRNAPQPPLLATQLQSIDGDAVESTLWRPLRNTLQPFWTDRAMRNRVSWDDLTEIDFLRFLKVSRDVADRLAAVEAEEQKQ